MKQPCHQFRLSISLALLCLVTARPIYAQSITRDRTLSTKVTSSDGLNFVIEDGSLSGGNLFHSFSNFSVPDGGSASFQGIDQGIENVISRVTGSSASNINGLIKMLRSDGTASSANFFLLNPKGIIFGPNAQLDVGGSFLASTASSLTFLDGKEFSAVNPQATAPLLKVGTPIGLQFGRSAASIQVLGEANLQVLSGKTLGLVGGKLTLEGGLLRASDSLETGIRIELGSVAAPASSDLGSVQVNLTKIDQGWALGYDDVQNFQDIQLSQDTVIEATGGGSGSVQVQGRRVALTDGSRIIASTEGSEPVGGTLAVNASESVTLSGISANSQLPSGLFAPVQLEATGKGANVIIETGQLFIRDGARVETYTLGAGNAGNLSLEARQLVVRDGALVLTSTLGAGAAGNLTVQASRVELVGINTLSDGRIIPSSLLAIARATSTKSSNPTQKTGGNLTIETEQLTVRDGAQIAVTTFSERNAGELTVDASEVQLSGTVFRENGALIVSGLFAGSEEGTKGNGGNLTINTDRLTIQDGAEAQVSTLGDGDAGNLIVNASESIELTGKTPDGKFPSGLLAVSGLEDISPEAQGQGGDIKVETPQLIVRDGAEITVSSINRTSAAKGAGNITVAAPAISLDNGDITAATASGNGGNIAIQVPNVLVLRRGSNISTSAGTAQVDGDGGNITINTNSIVAVPQENSDITANAFSGSGGNVDIEVRGNIFGLEPRSRQELQELLGTDNPSELDPSQLPSNDITAISQTNPSLDGLVTINTPDVDPSEQLANLPTEPVSTEIAQGCQAGSAKGTSRFINSGSGGLPTNPYEPLNSRDILADVQAPTEWTAKPSGAAKVSTSSSKTPASIVEAQGWSTNDKGEVVLVAQVPHDLSQRSCRLH